MENFKEYSPLAINISLFYKSEFIIEKNFLLQNTWRILTPSKKRLWQPWSHFLNII